MSDPKRWLVYVTTNRFNDVLSPNSIRAFFLSASNGECA